MKRTDPILLPAFARAVVSHSSHEVEHIYAECIRQGEEEIQNIPKSESYILLNPPVPTKTSPNSYYSSETRLINRMQLKLCLNRLLHII